jgi:hypothetical protein
LRKRKKEKTKITLKLGGKKEEAKEIKAPKIILKT